MLVHDMECASVLNTGETCDCTAEILGDSVITPLTSMHDEQQLYIDPVAAAAQPTDPVTSHPLYPILRAAIEQCINGKGTRHGGGKTPFMEQPWKHYANMHGRGFLTGQAAKKAEEAASTRTGGAFETEILGAIVYLGAAILHERTS